MECLFYLPQLTCKFDSSATASWLQFFGSMAALVLAILLPEITRRREEKARYLHVLTGITALIGHLKSLTSQLSTVLDDGKRSGHIFQVQHAYADTMNGALKKIAEIGLHDVHDPEILVTIGLLQFGIQRAVEEVLLNWPATLNDRSGFVEVPQSALALLDIIGTVENKIKRIPKP